MSSILFRGSASCRTRLAYRYIPRFTHRTRSSSHRFAALMPALQTTDTSIGYCWLLPTPSLSSHNCSTTKTKSMVLASSSQPTFLQRVTKLLQSWFDGLWVCCRITEILLRMFPFLLLVPASLFSRTAADWSWKYLRWTICQLGPCYIKLAQWIATRRDFVPAFICQRLGVLHDRGIRHSTAGTHTALAAALGNEWHTICTLERVIGCGSAAQVYKGTLRNRAVAIKVLHPGLAEAMSRDMGLVKIVTDWLHPWMRMVNLPRVVENFDTILHRQTDLRTEAENLQQFRENFGTDGLIVFPEPIFASRSVLVEDLVEDSQPISDYLAQDYDSDDGGVKKQLASPLLRAFLKMVFIDNFVHCDLHPGNILVQTEQVPERKGWFTTTGPSVRRKIVFLDAGIATSLSKNDQRNLLDLFRAVLLDDGEQAGRLMVERAKYERCSSVEGGVDAFAKGISELVSEFHDRRREGLTLGAVRIGSLLSRVLDLCRRYGVEIDPAMASIVVSTLVLEGLGRSLEPNLNLIDFAVPFVLGRGQVIAS